MTSGTDTRLLLASVAVLLVTLFVRPNVARSVPAAMPLLNVATVAAGVLVLAVLIYVTAARRVLLLTAAATASLLVVAVCMALIANYRAQFDMEMTYPEMMAHIRPAAVVLACAACAAVASLFGLFWKLRHSGKRGVPPN